MPVIAWEQLRGLPVVDCDDVLVGAVEDTVVDLAASDVYYLVVLPAGALEGQGLGRARLAVPLRACAVLPDRLRLPPDAATIARMPRIAPDQPGFGSKEYEAKIFGCWGAAPIVRAAREGMARADGIPDGLREYLPAGA